MGRQPLTLPSLFLLGACGASVGAAPGGGVRTGTVGFSPNPTAAIVTSVIARPIDQVWRAMPGVYASLGIPLTIADVNTHTVGNEGIKLRKELAGTALSHYIECGTTQIGPNADSYDVVLTIVTQLQASDGGGTKLTTSFEASAKPVTYSQDYSRCSSKGLLEARLADTLTARMTK